MTINIKYQDIFDYITKRSNYDPIEKQIDPTRYEVFDVSIYDHTKKLFYPQSEDFLAFCKQVSSLRMNPPDVDSLELIAICKDLLLIAPKEVNLTNDLTYL